MQTSRILLAFALALIVIISTTQVDARKIGGFGAPAYLSVPGFQQCLLTHEGSHASLCLPDTKPQDCLEDSWTQLRTVFRGDHCSREHIVA